MTLLSVVKDVCATVGVLVPQSVFTNITANRTMQEMVTSANEMAQRLAYDERDWTLFKKTATIVGDGSTTAFNLPVNYKRMLLTSNLWRSTSTLHPMRFVPDTDQWLNRRSRTIYDAWGEWTLMGGQILISPALAAGETVYYAYLDKNCIALASGGFGTSFVADGDIFALDERVLKLGMIWDWKSKKGSPYQEDLASYEVAKSFIEKNDNPAPIIIGRNPLPSGARTAYPWPVPTP